MTTEKDAAKLKEMTGIDHAGILVVNVAIDFPGNDGTILRNILKKVLSSS